MKRLGRVRARYKGKVPGLGFERELEHRVHRHARLLSAAVAPVAKHGGHGTLCRETVKAAYLLLPTRFNRFIMDVGLLPF